MIVFRMSGEHPDLPLEEIKALHEAYGVKFKIVSREGQLVLAESGLEKTLPQRLAFTHEYYPVLEITDAMNLERVLLEMKVKKPESLCVRCMGFPVNTKQERVAGDVLHTRWNARVNFVKPNLWVYLINVSGHIAVCVERFETDDFNKRDPNLRPFFHPLALFPKLSRLFLNLARLKEGDLALDPFCGTGSILIEAALLGLRPIGSDLDRKMLWGSKKNLDSYGLKASVVMTDATDIELKTADRRPVIVDGIATDPPYGRSSKLFDNEIGELYTKFLSSAFKVLKPGGYLVMAVPHEAEVKYKKAGFEKSGTYDIYVHASLTRRIYILRKPK